MCSSVERAGVWDSEKKGNMTEIYINLEDRKFEELIRETSKLQNKKQGMIQLYVIKYPNVRNSAGIFFLN